LSQRVEGSNPSRACSLILERRVYERKNSGSKKLAFGTR
jgi:hypothetical protein